MAQRMNILLYRDVESLWMTIIFPLSTKETNMELNSLFCHIYIYIYAIDSENCGTVSLWALKGYKLLMINSFCCCSIL